VCSAASVATPSTPARLADLRDKDGEPLIKWDDAESAFEAWKRCSAGRPCDYTGISYGLLRGPSGIQWPCNERAPAGTERLYPDGEFFGAAPDTCESYGKDMITGAPQDQDEYKGLNPDGKAIIKAAEYVGPHGQPSSQFPYQLTTGRTLYHFHTRTKTARAPQLNAAAPQVWIEMSKADAAREDFCEGDLIEVASARGQIQGQLRISGIRDGIVFVPFHYGYWDAPDGPGRAANELTITDWDPLSKQPIFKTAAASVRRLSQAKGPSSAPTTTASAPVTAAVPATVGGPQATSQNASLKPPAGHRHERRHQRAGARIAPRGKRTRTASARRRRAPPHRARGLSRHDRPRALVPAEPDGGGITE
jgi:hypothetical protein